jgi:renalase
MNEPSPRPIVIVGAGLSGLVAAHALVSRGIECVILDKGRSAGGRLATRRLGGATVRADSGAQFFTVRSPDFAELVHDWRRAGIVSEWCRGFASVAGAGGIDGHPRYIAMGGMNTIAKYLAASLNVETDVRVTSVGALDGGSGANGGLVVSSADGRSWLTDTVLLSPPVPQSLVLLDAGELALSEVVRRDLDAVTYARCFALLVKLDRASGLPEPGGIQLSVDDDPTFSFVADNEQKGISDEPTMTFHTHEGVSVRRWDEDRASLESFLLTEAKRFTGAATIVESYVHGWKFSRPLSGYAGTHLIEHLPGGRRIGFMGDAFSGAKVEGAALSGLAIAESLAADG